MAEPIVVGTNNHLATDGIYRYVIPNDADRIILVECYINPFGQRVIANLVSDGGAITLLSNVPLGVELLPIGLTNDTLSASEAVYAYTGWLTSQERTTIMGSSHDASDAAINAQHFIDTYGFSPLRDNWNHRLMQVPDATFTDSNITTALTGKESSNER